MRLFFDETWQSSNQSIKSRPAGIVLKPTHDWCAPIYWWLRSQMSSHPLWVKKWTEQPTCLILHGWRSSRRRRGRWGSSTRMLIWFVWPIVQWGGLSVTSENCEFSRRAISLDSTPPPPHHASMAKSLDGNVAWLLRAACPSVCQSVCIHPGMSSRSLIFRDLTACKFFFVLKF